MSGKKRGLRGHHRDQIDITTTDVLEGADGSVAKLSSVNVAANDDQQIKPLWIGLKIGARQKVRLLIVNRLVWVDNKTREDAAAHDAFTSMFHPADDEKWAAYYIPVNLKRRLTRHVTRAGLSFETKLTLSGRSAAVDPDAQSIPIAVCYVPDDPRALSRKDILLGHSLVQAPPKARKSARGKSRATKRGARRRHRR